MEPISRLFSLAYAWEEKAIGWRAEPMLGVRDELWLWKGQGQDGRPAGGVNIGFITHPELPKDEARIFRQPSLRFAGLLKKVNECDARRVETCKAKRRNRDITCVLEECTQRCRKRCQNATEFEDISLEARILCRKPQLRDVSSEFLNDFRLRDARGLCVRDQLAKRRTKDREFGVVVAAKFLNRFDR